MDDVLKDQYFRLDVLKYEYRIAKFYNILSHISHTYSIFFSFLQCST